MAVKVKQTTFFLFGLRVSRMLIAMVSASLSAKYFGVTIEKDIWVYSLALMTTISGALWGPLNETFRAQFIFIREEKGEEAAQRATASLVGFIIFVSLIVGLGLLCFSNQLSSSLLDKNFDGGALFTIMIILLIPSFLISETTSICTSILNAYEIFYIPEFTSIISGILHILILISLAEIIGIYSLVVSYYLGIFLLFFAIIYFLRKNNIYILKGIFPFDFNKVKGFLLFSLPFFIPYFVAQVNTLSQKYLAGLMGSGSISSLDYSQQLSSVIQSTMSSVLSTILVPVLAKSFAEGNLSEYKNNMKESLRTVLIIYGICSFALIGATRPVCEFLFLHGKLSMDSLSIIIDLSRIYGIALFGVMLYIYFSIVMLTIKQGKLYAFIGVFTQIMVLISNISLWDKLGLYIFPISFGAAHLLTALIMFCVVNVKGKKELAIFLVKSFFLILLGVSVFVIVNSKFNFDSLVSSIIENIALAIIVVPLFLIGMGVHVQKISSMFPKK